MPGGPFDFNLDSGSQIEEIALLVKLLAAAAVTDQRLSIQQIDGLLGVIPESREGR